MKLNILNNFAVLSALLFLSIDVCLSLPRWHQGKLYHDDRDYANSKDSSLGDIDTSKFAKFHTQKLDHFDQANHNTFQQRYFVNTTFWKEGSNAPVFLCVGGEGPPLTYTVLIASDHCNDIP